MTRRTIFDGHHHLWDLTVCHYPWLMAKGERRFFGDPTPIQKNYSVRDFLADAGHFDLVGSAHIQVGVAEHDSVNETRWLQGLINSGASAPSVVIGFADLTAPDFAQTLESHARADAFRGIRQIIGRHPVEDANTKTSALLDHPAFAEGLTPLARNGLSFDLQLTEAQYEKAANVFSRLDDLKLAICHFGSPWDLSPDGFARWQTAMKRFARLPGASLKLSGFGMFKPDWNIDDIRPYIETGLALFGEDRCFAGSNFPVDKLYGGYDRIWLAIEEIIGSGDTYTKLTRTNAMHFYGVSAQT